MTPSQSEGGTRPCRVRLRGARCGDAGRASSGTFPQPEGARDGAGGRPDPQLCWRRGAASCSAAGRASTLEQPRSRKGCVAHVRTCPSGRAIAIACDAPVCLPPPGEVQAQLVHSSVCAGQVSIYAWHRWRAGPMRLAGDLAMRRWRRRAGEAGGRRRAASGRRRGGRQRPPLLRGMRQGGVALPPGRWCLTSTWRAPEGRVHAAWLGPALGESPPAP